MEKKNWVVTVDLVIKAKTAEEANNLTWDYLSELKAQFKDCVDGVVSVDATKPSKL